MASIPGVSININRPIPDYDRKHPLYLSAPNSKLPKSGYPIKVGDRIIVKNLYYPLPLFITYNAGPLLVPYVSGTVTSVLNGLECIVVVQMILNDKLMQTVYDMKRERPIGNISEVTPPPPKRFIVPPRIPTTIPINLNYSGNYNSEIFAQEVLYSSDSDDDYNYLTIDENDEVLEHGSVI